MKVLQVCAYAARYGGNFLASLRALETLLAEQGVETAYLFPETARDMPWCRDLQQRARVHFAGLNRFSPAVFKQVKAAMADADIIHSHFELYDCLTALAKKKGQKLFWHLHDSFDEEIDLPHRAINRLQYGFFGKKAVLISPNDYYSNYVAALGFPEKQIFHVDNGVEFTRMNKEEREKEYDFLVFGGFYRIKGLDVLMDACRILRGKGISYRLGVVGYPDTWRFLDENYPDLHRQICRLEPSENVSDFYNAASVFISASRRETFSYSLLEALYMERSAIISDIPGTGWANGYASVTVFPSEDAAALADAMERQLAEPKSPAVRRSVSEEVQKRYSAQIWAERIKEIYFGT
jgi:glycosyltransferase involved in cell wall biosynthesis